MPPFKNNEDWFQRQTAELKEQVFNQFNGDFQAFLKWCSEPYKDSIRTKEAVWQKPN